MDDKPRFCIGKRVITMRRRGKYYNWDYTKFKVAEKELQDIGYDTMSKEGTETVFDYLIEQGKLKDEWDPYKSKRKG